jgi:hypothetical protein
LVPAAQEAALQEQPSAVLVLANWVAQQTRQDMGERLRRKWDLTRRLYQAGLGRREILELYRLIDWLLVLPEGLARQFKQQLMSYEQSQVMPYVTSIERMAKEEGRAEGRTEGRIEGRTEGRTEGMVETILRQLHRRCGSVSPTAETRIRALPAERLQELAESLLEFESQAHLQTWLTRHE